MAQPLVRLNDVDFRTLGLSSGVAFEVLTITGRGMAPTRGRELNFPGDIGSRDYGSKPAARLLTISGVLHADSIHDFRNGLDKLREIVSINTRIDDHLVGEIEAQTLWFADESIEHRSTAQAGADATVTLDTVASAVDDYYNDMEIEIVHGTGVGQKRRITDYVGASKIATVDANWVSAPDATSILWIVENRYHLVNYSGQMNDTRLENNWFSIGCSNITLPFKAVYPYVVGDWIKSEIIPTAANKFFSYSNGTAPSWPMISFRGSAITPEVIEASHSLVSHFDGGTATDIQNQSITATRTSSMTPQAGKYNQALSLVANRALDADTVSMTLCPLQSGNSTGLNLHAGTLGGWFQKTGSWDSAGTQNLYHAKSDGNNQLVLSVADGSLSVELNDQSINYDASAWVAGEWYEIVVRYSSNISMDGTNYIELWAASEQAGSITQVAAGTTKPVMPTTTPDTAYLGSNNGANGFAGRIDDFIITDYPITDAEITGAYNSGAGATFDTELIAPPIVFGSFDGTAGEGYGETGLMSVGNPTLRATDITQGVDEDAITVAADATKFFFDGDEVIISDDTGYKVGGFIDGDPPSDTLINVDNGAGSDPGTTGLVGVFADLDGAIPQNFIDAYDASSLKITGSMSATAWIKPDSVGGKIFSKWSGSGNQRGYIFSIGSDGKLEFAITKGGDGGSGGTGRSIADAVTVDGKWHHVGFAYETSGAGDNETVTFYIDGVAIADDGLGATGSMMSSIHPSTAEFTIGNYDGGLAADNFDGGIRDVCLFDGVRTPADMFTSATRPFEDVSAATDNVSQWLFNEAAAATTINDESSNGNDLELVGDDTTNFGSHSRTQIAYISKNITAKSDMNSGGIGGWTRNDTKTTLTKDGTITKTGNRSLKITNADADPSYALQTIITTSEAPYVLRFWHYGPPNIVGVEVLAYVDGVQQTAAQSGITAEAWSFIELCFEADSSSVLCLRTPSGTLDESSYYDGLEVRPSLATNGGFQGTYALGLNTGWELEGSPTPSKNASDEHSGTAAQQIESTAEDEGIKQEISTVEGRWYEVSGWFKRTAGSGTYGIKLDPALDPSGNSRHTSPSGSSASYERLSLIFQALGSATDIKFVQVGGTALTFIVDDVSVTHRPDMGSLSAITQGARFEPTELGRGYLAGGNETWLWAAIGNANEYSARIRWRPQFPADIGTPNGEMTIFRHAASATDFFDLNYNPLTDQFQFVKVIAAGESDSNSYQATSGVMNFRADDILEIGVVSDPTSGVLISINGDTNGSSLHTNTDSLISYPNTIYLGNNPSAAQPAPGIFDEMEIMVKSVDLRYFGEKTRKQNAGANTNARLTYSGSLEAGDILTIDSNTRQVLNRIKLWDASAEVEIDKLTDASIRSSKLPMMAPSRSILYFPNSVPGGVTIFRRKNWQ